MLIALGGVIAGYDGSFSFERIGLEFPDTVPYVAMRLVSCFYLLLPFKKIILTYLFVCYSVYYMLLLLYLMLCNVLQCTA